MTFATISIIIQLLLMIAKEVPELAPKVKDMFDILRGVTVVDITQEEFEARIDEACTKLPIWE